MRIFAALFWMWWALLFSPQMALEEIGDA